MYFKSSNHPFYALNPGQIRLIQLQPGPVASPITYRLDNVLLEDAPPYTALSYVWGSPEPVNTVYIKDTPTPVTANLHTALVHVRQESSIVTLWVDALCICQDDQLEKSQQVQMMSRIFRKATSTFIWLGEPSDRDQVVADYLCKEHDRIDTQSTGSELKRVSIEALRHFFERPWFRRLWILQEAILSKQPIVHYGRFEIPFSSVLRLSTDLIFNNLGNHRGDVFSNCPLSRCMHEWDKVLQVVNERGGWPLIFALPMTERMESTLFEDRVYALLGLATPMDRQSIKPDYSKPLGDLQRELSAHLISSPVAPLQALHSMGIRVASEVPSWARNWTLPVTHSWTLTNPSRGGSNETWSMLPAKDITRLGYKWLNDRASQKPWTLKTPSNIGCRFVRFSEDLRICAIRGASVDYVDCVYVAPGEAELMGECERWKDAAMKNATAWSTQQARLEAFSKALCRGSYRDSGGNILTECHAAYEAWIKGLDRPDTDQTVAPGIAPVTNDFGHRVKRLCMARSFIITKKGFVGLAPGDTQVGDMICYFESCSDPFILRPIHTTSAEATSAAFVGDTLIVGLMEGKGLESAETCHVVEYWIQ